MRLDKPIGIYLLLFPCWWAVGLASNGHPSPLLLLWFLIGAVAMRSAGCIINDMVDREFDAQVERTKHRPLASGVISLSQANLLLFILLLLSLIIVCQFKFAVFLLALLALPFVLIYPFMKRITYFPQVFLGFTFNFGALMGFAAVHDKIGPSALLLYAGGIFWTLGYDTIYAHQDKQDDRQIGVKSTALKWGENSKFWIRIFYSLACIFWYLAGMHLIGLFLAAFHLAWQVESVNLDNTKSCHAVFRSNAITGLLILIGTFV